MTGLVHISGVADADVSVAICAIRIACWSTPTTGSATSGQIRSVATSGYAGPVLLRAVFAGSARN